MNKKQKNQIKSEQIFIEPFRVMEEIVDTSLEVYDEVELANFAEQRFVTGAINNILRQLPDPSKQSLKQCEDCEEDIPEARRKALPGVTKCITCQQEIEDIKKRKMILQGYVYRNE